MIILIQDNETNEVETIRADDLGIGIHENWSMISYTNDKGCTFAAQSTTTSTTYPASPYEEEDT